MKIVCDNRQAFYNYSIEEKIEAGIVLLGSEVKSLRDGKANLKDAYAVFQGHELFLLNAHINPYLQANRQNHDPLRTRKLLLKESELTKWWNQSQIRGYSIIPLKIYFKDSLAKVELGLGKGKKLHDKRASEKDREAKRYLDRATKQYKS